MSKQRTEYRTVHDGALVALVHEYVSHAQGDKLTIHHRPYLIYSIDCPVVEHGALNNFADCSVVRTIRVGLRSS